MHKTEVVCKRQSRSVWTDCEHRAGGFDGCAAEEACTRRRCRSLLRGQDPDNAQHCRGLGALNFRRSRRPAKMNVATFAQMREFAKQIFRHTLSEISLQKVLSD